MRNQDRFRGCLIGGAAGDALGYAVEFLPEYQILHRYGEGGITGYQLTGGIAQFSDDTQMTLFTAEGLMRAKGGDYAGSIRTAYLDWLKTQNGPYPPAGGTGGSRLLEEPGLYSPRAPGTTCMSALSGGGFGTLFRPVNNSKGCGGVMRVAPVGLFFSGRGADVKEAAKLGAEAAAITHGHILGWMPAAVLAQMVCELASGDLSVREAALHALDTVKELWPQTPERTYFLKMTEMALNLAGEAGKDLDAVHRIGEGWVGEEALAIAVYCAVKYENDFEKALVTAVNHNGDSDSTGAIAGNILGAKLGLAGIPEKFLQNLELKDLLIETADRLYNS